MDVIDITAARAGPRGDYPPLLADGEAFRVIPQGLVDDLRQVDVVLCYRNDTRRYLNQLTRWARGIVSGPVKRDGSFHPKIEQPRQWEPVLLLESAPAHDLRAGNIKFLDGDVRPGDTAILLFEISESPASAGPVEYPLLTFAGMPKTGGVPGGLELDFAYALTVHRARGCGWSSALIYDDLPPDDPRRARWLDPPLVRASQRIVIVNGSYRDK